jgi:hypothetical protein
MRSIRITPFAAMLACCALCTHLAGQTTQPASTPPPAGAIVLFDGSDLSHWQTAKGEPAGWEIADGAVHPVPKAPDIVSKDKFEDCTIHIEFRTPIPAEGDKGQHRGNSGVFLQGRYEMQVLESFGLPTSPGDCGAIYSLKAADKNMALPPMEWQSYDITFKTPRYDAEGKKTENARVTLVWNGQKVHDNAEIVSPTRDHKGAEPPGAAPISLQNHGFAVQFRNIWVVPASAGKTKE